MGNFLGFMLTRKEIEANPNKSQEIINMRSPTLVKIFQQMTERIATQSIHFFTTIKKLGSFQWTEKCDKGFQELKSYIWDLPILSYHKEGPLLIIYSSVTKKTLSSVLV